MLGLLRRLSAVDADAASAVMVIGFFDALVEQDASIDVILRETAALAECPVGVRTANGRLSERLEPGGATHFGAPLADSRRYRLPSGDEVWLERDGTEHPLDELVTERFALAVAFALGREHRDLTELDQSALLQLAISSAASDSERRRVLERLGVKVTSTVHVLAVAGAAARLDEIDRCLTGKYRTRVGAIEVRLASQPLQDTMAIPVGCRVGVASPHLAADLPQAWREARTALRFTLPSKHPARPCPPFEPAIVRFDALGAFGTIAEALTADQISQTPDVIALDKLAERADGGEMLRILEAVAATDSVRRAALVLHMNHNSVGRRVARAEQILGYPIADLYARPKLMLALALRRIRESAALF
jgi:hypothetical protein